MEITATRIFEQNATAWLDPTMRRSLNEGGTASSKTYSILQLLILIAQNTKVPLVISVVSESLPHLKRGAIRDFFRILGEPIDGNPRFNKTENVYSAGKGIVEFFGADEPAKVRGPRRDILFINESNNVPWETARGLDVRTSIFTFADWNPVSEFWAHEHWIGQPGNAYIHSTYIDAKEVLPEQVVKDIESYRDTDPNWWNIYGLGLIGKIEGLVYPDFSLVDDLPPGGDKVYGLDFGFSSDPAVLTENKIFPGEIYSRELFYERGLTNPEIAELMDDFGVIINSDIVWADSAEPKSIEEIYQYGFNIQGAPKGPGSVEYGHQRVRQMKQYWTKDSTNCIKEQRNFRYIEDKNGKLTEKTTHSFSHGMDSRRYGVTGYYELVPTEEVVVYDTMSEVRDLDI